MDLWLNNENKKNVHYMEWEKLMLSNNLRRIGFHDLTGFNQGLLAKKVQTLLNLKLCLDE